MGRLIRYLYSNSNIAGCGLAALGLALYFAGVVHAGWLAIVIGMYFAGALAFAFRSRPAHMPPDLSTADALEWLKSEVLPKLPAPAAAILTDILARVDSLMPRLKEMETQGIVESSGRATLKQTIVRYLPDAVEAYLRLPPVYAKTHKASSGKTAAQMLEEQLKLLQKHVQEVEQGVYSEDINKLLTNGRFLQERLVSPLEI